MKNKTLLYSLLSLCVCAALVVGGTFALFSDKVTVNNHLDAGNLDIGLHRTSLKKYELDETTGLMANKPENTDKVDLTKDNNPVFTMTNAVPTSRYEATIEVSNLGSTAFDYGVRILWSANQNQDDNDETLAKQIRITITSTKLTAPVVFMLSECAGRDIPLGYLLKNTEAESFTVTAEFLNDIDFNENTDNPDNHISNNSAMLATLTFDVQVYATQKTALDTTAASS